MPTKPIFWLQKFENSQLPFFLVQIELRTYVMGSCTLWSTQKESNLDLHKLLKVLHLAIHLFGNFLKVMFSWIRLWK